MDDPDASAAWQNSINNLRNKIKPKKQAMMNSVHDAQADPYRKEALMTLVALMQSDDDPRVQLSAAKTLLERSLKEPILQNAPQNPIMQNENLDDIDAAIALAKKLLDELAVRKTQSVADAGAMDLAGASTSDHTDR